MDIRTVISLIAACTVSFATPAHDDIYSSTDGGITWSLSGLADTDVSDLLFRPDDPQALIARGGARLYESTDGGATWERLDDGSLRNYTIGDAGMAGAPLPNSVRSILIDRGSPAVIDAIGEADEQAGASGEGTGLMRSDDGGRSWIPLYSLPLPTVHCLEQNADLQRVFVCGSPLRETARPAEMYVTADGGASWEQLHCCTSGDAETWERISGLEQNPPNSLRRAAVADIVVDATNPDIAYARTSYGIAKTENRGTWWSFVGLRNEFAPLHALAVDPSSPSTLYATKAPDADEVLWHSTDGGTSWHAHGAAPVRGQHASVRSARTLCSRSSRTRRKPSSSRCFGS